MAQTLEFCDSHNMIAYLKKPKQASGFEEIIDFLNKSYIQYSLTVNPTIYLVHIHDFWNSAKIEVIDNVKTLVAKVEENEVKITESTIRNHLHLNDDKGITTLPNETLFSIFKDMGYEGSLSKLTFYKALLSPQWKLLVHVVQQCISRKRSTWNEFNKSIATAVACLASGQVFNFSNMIFEGLQFNLSTPEGKFLMYPRFVQHIITSELSNLNSHAQKYLSPMHSPKLFANMRRQGKDFSGKVTPLFSTMVSVTLPTGEGPSDPIGSQPTPVSVPTDSVPTVSVPTTSKPSSPQPETVPSSTSPHISPQPTTSNIPIPSSTTSTPPPTSASSPAYTKTYTRKQQGVPSAPEAQPSSQQKVVPEEEGDHVGRAQTTDDIPSMSQDSLKGDKTQPTATPVVDSQESPSGGPWCQETMGEGSAHARHEGPSDTFNDPSAAGTQQTEGEDRYNYTIPELMACMVKMQEQINAQAKDIDLLQGMVIGLLQANKKKKYQKRAGVSRLKRMKKAGTSQKILSSSSSSSEDAPKGDDMGADKSEEAPQTEKEPETASTGETPVSTAPVDSSTNEEEVTAAAKAKQLEEEAAAAESIRLAEEAKKEEEKEKKRKFDEEVARRKIAQASKPKAKGIEIKEASKPSAGSQPTYKGKGKRKVGEENTARAPSPGSQTSAEKKIDQIEQDEVYAQEIQKQLEKELIAEEKKKKEEERKQKSKKFITKNTKKEADRDKFMSYLKQTGKYSGKQLGPMKMSTLVELYDKERKLEREAKERRRYEEERAREVEAEEDHEALKRKNSKRPREVNTGVADSTAEPAETKTSAETPLKKHKTHESTSKPTEEHTSEEEKKVVRVVLGVHEVDDDQVNEHADRTKDQMTQLIRVVTIPEQVPMQSKAPIIDWYASTVSDRCFYNITRADKSFCRLKGVTVVFSLLPREDLNEMYKIGKIKYGNRGNQEFNNNFLLLDHFIMMYDPELVEDKVGRFVSVVGWTLNEVNGTYQLKRGDGMIEYYLVEKQYKHGLNVMIRMLEKKLRAPKDSQMAEELLWKITCQIRGIRDDFAE